MSIITDDLNEQLNRYEAHKLDTRDQLDKVKPQSRESSVSRSRRETSKDTSQSRINQEVISPMITDEIYDKLQNVKLEEHTCPINNNPIVDVHILYDNDKNIESEKITALLDTGAMLSAVNSDKIKNLEHHLSKKLSNRNSVKPIFSRVKVDKVGIIGAFQQQLILADSKVKLNIELTDLHGITKQFTHEFYEIKTLYAPMILGADFFSQFKMTVSCKPAAVIFTKNNKIKLPNGKNKSYRYKTKQIKIITRRELG